MTIRPFKNRALPQQGAVVEVYYDLHRKCYSIRDVKSNLVVAKADYVNLHLAMFNVREAGRQRVLREKVKNVHATIVGLYVDAQATDTSAMHPAYYNPYKVATFVDADTQRPLYGTEHVHCANKQAWYI